MSVAGELMGHFDQLYAEIEISVRAFPERLWRREDQTDLLRVPAFMAHHTVWCMALEHLLNIPSDSFPNDICPPYDRAKTPTPDEVSAMLAGVKKHTREVYGSMGDDEFLAKRDRPHVPLGALTYALAHGRQHLGQLAQILKENDITPPGWYPLG